MMRAKNSLEFLPVDVFGFFMGFYIGMMQNELCYPQYMHQPSDTFATGVSLDMYNITPP
jgi:hypothetical protein